MACNGLVVRDTFNPQVSFLAWMAIAGVLLLAMSTFASQLRRLPVSSSAVYLVFGVIVGPLGLDWVRLDFVRNSTLLEHLTEIAVVISLFIGGLKLRLPIRHSAWSAVWRLAAALMLVSIVVISLFAHYVLGFEIATAMLLGAVLAPTDPVLASAVSVNEASDRDRLRYGLSGEAGLNDGMAFPFVVFAIGWHEHLGPGRWMTTWALGKLVWAVPVALVIGYSLSRYLGAAAMRRRSAARHTPSTSDFLALSFIALSYVLAELAQAWGFLAVFAAGVGFRAAEVAIVRESPHPDVPRRESGDGAVHPPAEDLVSAKVREDALEQPAVAAGATVSESLSFGDTAERILELLLVCIVGVSLCSHWDNRAIAVALALFVVIRPLSTRLVLIGTPTSPAQRWLMGWFGVRGIGTLYYVSYSINNPISAGMGAAVVDITISVVALSVIVHGVSARPLLSWYERQLTLRRPDESPAARGPGSRR